VVNFNQADIDRVRRLYDRRVEELGDQVKTVGWSSEESQFMRFDILSRGLGFEGKSILDIGCGLGDFVRYAAGRGLTFRKYTGLDISEQLISTAKAKWNKRKDCSFEVGDIDQLESGSDIVIISGALNLKLADNPSYIGTMLRKAWKKTNKVLAVNFLSTYVDYENSLNYHTDPSWAFAECRSISDKVILYDDYPLWEFTIQMHK